MLSTLIPAITQSRNTWSVLPDSPCHDEVAHANSSAKAPTAATDQGRADAAASTGPTTTTPNNINCDGVARSATAQAMTSSTETAKTQPRRHRHSLIAAPRHSCRSPGICPCSQPAAVTVRRRGAGKNPVSLSRTAGHSGDSRPGRGRYNSGAVGLVAPPSA
nr:hypothetical protein GCM10020092_032730 [Actinoplanes digitatis]